MAPSRAIPFDADISLDGKGSTKDANVDNYNTLYVVASREAGAGTIYGKLGYSHADIGSVTTDSEVTVNSQSDSLEGIMVGAGIQSGELDNGWTFDLDIATTNAGAYSATTIGIGTCITIERGQPHQLIALEDMSEIFEVSTEHFDEDSYRIRTGDKLWVENIYQH